MISRYFKKNKNGKYGVRIPSFDIHHNIVGKKNESERITTSSYKIRCHPKDSKILKVLLAKYYADPKTISFVLFVLARMTCNTTYHHQIIMQNNFITSTSVILVYGIAKKVMKKKLYNKLIQFLVEPKSNSVLK